MIVAYIDGGARGNPGPAGLRRRASKRPTARCSPSCTAASASPPTTSRNTTACSRRCDGPSITVNRGVRIRADSELLVKQMRGEYKVKNPGLQPLYVRARLLVMSLDEVVFEHVRRELNKEADRLSNLGMDDAEAALRGR